ncbi:glycosyltransferase family 2 protein [Luteimicrobium subarcticum]|uniref:Cellulose synthase (UDP-forming) n=1 Tax=Luteimicrobium subarcticum TaxID=620910 RepID=A0A2M8WRW5_9MICO|nr:cellulose synthase catalytic subunit [Luteimicrobium subarcticum]PJI93658.1 cellulose synthase (UDP-forming) [Luteimicrobium subarcticum]
MTVTAPRHGRTRPVVRPPGAGDLPAPPTDAELYAYLGPQRRWVLVATDVAFVATMASLLVFTLRSWAFWPFLVFFALSVVGAVLSTASGLRRRRVSRADHEARLLLWPAGRAADDHPSVDVFLPTAGEPLTLLENTYRHVAALRWPGVLRVHVLDDADRPEVADAARAHGFVHHVRANRGELKKAGNLHAAYQRTDGDLVVVLDADFCPRPDLLDHLVPSFDDPTVGIVQSPQVFDTTARMGWVQRTAGAAQELFYRWIQPSRDAVGAAICVGTSAVYRRTALDANGGFARIAHSEDVYTGLQLQEHGYGLCYVPVQVSKGVCPDTTDSFLNQQYRWCLGAMSLLASRDFHRMAMTGRQRVAHWAGFLFYVTTALGVFLGELPGLVVLATDPRSVHPWAYLALLPAVWVRLVLVPGTSTTVWRFEVLRVQLLYSLTHVVAIVDTLRRREAAWVPTSAAVSARRRGGVPVRVARLGVVWLTTLLAGLVAALARATVTVGIGQVWVAGLLVALFAYVAVPVVVELWPLARGRVARPAVSPRSRARARARAGRRGASEHHLDRPLAWPESVAWTAVVVLVAIVASGQVHTVPLV